METDLFVLSILVLLISFLFELFGFVQRRLHLDHDGSVRVLLLAAGLGLI